MNNWVGRGADGQKGPDGGQGAGGGSPPPKMPAGLPNLIPGVCSWTGSVTLAAGPGGPGPAGIPGLLAGGPGSTPLTPGQNGTAGITETIDARNIMGTLLLDVSRRWARNGYMSYLWQQAVDKRGLKGLHSRALVFDVKVSPPETPPVEAVKGYHRWAQNALNHMDYTASGGAK